MRLSVLKIILLLLFITSQNIARAKKTSEPVNSKPSVASLGVLIVNVYELDMASNSFYADFYLWCRWKGKVDPLKDLEFTNSEEQWGFTKTELYEAPLKLKNDIYYNCIHVQGKFRHNFVLNNYPIDEQKLDIVLENSFYTSDELIYKADLSNSKFQPDISIPGWEIERFYTSNTKHVYSSNFGLPETPDNDKYSNLTFSVSIKRPLEFFIWKLLLPLVIVLLSSLGATIIYPSYIDARIYAPVGALLTTVFLQQGYSSQLPDISYLILTDKIYVITYIAILTGIFHAIYTANLVKGGGDEDIKRAKKLDKLYIVVTVLFLCISTVSLYYYTL